MYKNLLEKDLENVDREPKRTKSLGRTETQVYHREDRNIKCVNNRYCSRCLRTRRFYEVDDHFVCERCRKMLFKATPDYDQKIKR